MNRPQTLKNTLFEQKVIHLRLIVGLGFAAILLMVILSRFLYLQIIQHDVFVTRSDSNRVHLQKIVPKRGLIFDQEQRLLAENKPSFLLTVTRDRVEDLEVVLAELLRLEIISERDVDRFLKRKSRVLFATLRVQ